MLLKLKIAIWPHSLFMTFVFYGIAFSAPIRVVTTTSQIAEAVTIVGGSQVEVKTLVAPGIDPHTYVATPSDVEALKAAEVIFLSGLHLEAQMERLLKIQSKTKTVVAVSDNLPKKDILPDPDVHGNFDPHFWHDVSLWRYAVKSISDTLIKVRVEQKQIFLSNFEAYDKILAKLDSDVLNELNRVHKNVRILVTIHDAFAYFAKRYGYKVENIQGMNTQSEASVADIKRVSDFLVRHKVPAIFVETSTQSRYALSVIEVAKAKGLDVTIAGELYADGPGDVKGDAGTYEGMVRTNVKTIVNALSGAKK
jgi:manganese/zinc/iron transport system substrate-binding protein